MSTFGATMLSNAQVRIAAELAPAVDPAPRPVDLLYVRPPGDFLGYEVHLRTVVSRFRDRIGFATVSAGELSRFTRERVFLGNGVPNIVLVRCGEVIAHAVGELPARELAQIVRSAAEHATR